MKRIPPLPIAYLVPKLLLGNQFPAKLRLATLYHFAIPEVIPLKLNVHFDRNLVLTFPMSYHAPGYY